MLAISSTKYYLPVKLTGDSGIRWLLVARKGDDQTFATKFNYTLQVKFEDDEFCDRFTACYDGSSVKPAARTLRVFGAERCQRVVSYLSSMDDVEFVLDHVPACNLIFKG